MATEAAAAKAASLGLPKLNSYPHSRGGRGGSREGGGGGEHAGGGRSHSASHLGGSGPAQKPQRRRTLERKLARAKGTNRMVDSASGAMMGRAQALANAKTKLRRKLAAEGGAAVAPIDPAAEVEPVKKKQKLAAPAVKKAQLLPSSASAASAASSTLPDFLRALGVAPGARDSEGGAAVWDLDEEMRYYEQQLGVRKLKKKKQAAAAAAAAKSAAGAAAAPADDGNESDDAELDTNALSKLRAELAEDGLGDLFDFCDLLEKGEDTTEADGLDELYGPDRHKPLPSEEDAAETKKTKKSKKDISVAAADASSGESGYSLAKQARIRAKEAEIDAREDEMAAALEAAMSAEAARKSKDKVTKANDLQRKMDELAASQEEDWGPQGDDDEDDEVEDEDGMDEDEEMPPASRKRRREEAEEEEDDEDAAEDDEEDEDNEDDDAEDQGEGEDDDEDGSDAAEEDGEVDERGSGSDEDASDADDADGDEEAVTKKKPSIEDLYGFNAPLPESLIAFRRGDKNILASGAGAEAIDATKSSTASGAAPPVMTKYVPPHLRAQMAAAAGSVAPASSAAAAAAAAVGAASASTPAGMAALRRQLKGLLNRLTPANLENIALQMSSTLYSTHSKREVTEVLCEQLLLLCTAESDQTTGGYAMGSNSSTLLAAAALVVFLHATIGSGDIGAHFLEQFVLSFREHASRARQISALAASGNHSQSAAAAAAVKSCTTLVTFLTYLYNFDLIHSKLVYELVRELLDDFSPVSIELLLVVLANCGYQLRKDDPSSLKEIVLLVQAKAKGAQAASKQTAAAASKSPAAPTTPAAPIPEGRVSFMLDMIYDLKNNKRRHTGLYESIQPLHHWLQGKIKSRQSKDKKGAGVTDIQLRFGYEDIINIPTRGRWWLVGSAWKGKRMGEDDSSSAAAATSSSAAGSSTAAAKVILPPEDSSASSVDLLSLAKAAHMNTSLRRSLFLVIMSATDYIECVERLSKLNLAPAQMRQVVPVLLECTANERLFNPYYSLVLLQLARMEGATGGKELRFTTQLSLWDRIKSWTEKEQLSSFRAAKLKSEEAREKWRTHQQRQALNLAKLTSLLLREPAAGNGGGHAGGGVGGGLSLSVLRAFDFHALAPLQLLFLTACLKDFLLQADLPHVLASMMRLHAAVDEKRPKGSAPLTAAQSAERRVLRDGVDFFLQHHLTPTATALKNKEQGALLKQRIIAARKALAGTVQQDWMFQK